MRERFEEIYRTNEWTGGGSGEGSKAVHTIGYRRFLSRYIDRYSIKSVIDLGCGDWQFSRLINWRGARYVGFDVVPELIDLNRRKFPDYTFEIAPKRFDDLPEGDLLIAKDLLQHWSHATIRSFLPVINRYRHVLITNCRNPLGETENQDIPDGGFRPLDLRRAPFSLPLEEVYSFRNIEAFWPGKTRWKKVVLAKTEIR